MALLSLTMAGCTQHDAAEDAVVSPSSARASSTVSPGAVEVPSLEPDAKSLVTASGVGDSAKSWQIDVDQGAMAIAVNCLGDGVVKVSARPKLDLIIRCDSSSITPSFNEISINESQTWALDFKASPSVTWAARVSQ